MLRRGLGVVALCVVSVPAMAGMFDDAEARARIDKLRADFTALSQTVDTASKNQIDFSNQLESLRIEVAKLRGQLEMLAYETEASQKRQRDFYVDLDTRLRKLEPSGEQPVAAAASDSGKPLDEAAATRDYDAALVHVKAARYREAVNAFTAFTKNHVGSEKMPGAYYWLGSSHAQLREYARAAEQYAKVPAGWPNDMRAADAMLGQGNALIDGGDVKGGNKVLEALLQQYPKSPAAQSARQRLYK